MRYQLVLKTPTEYGPHETQVSVARTRAYVELSEVFCNIILKPDRVGHRNIRAKALSQTGDHIRIEKAFEVISLLVRPPAVSFVVQIYLAKFVNIERFKLWLLIDNH